MNTSQHSGGMRRGFLNADSRKAKSRALKSDIKDPSIPSLVETHSSTTPTPVAIPAGFILIITDGLPSDQEALGVVQDGVNRDPQNFHAVAARIPGPGTGVLDLATTFAFYPGAKKPFIAHQVAPFDPMEGIYYRVADAPGAGKGIFATADHAPGALVIRERPLVVQPMAGMLPMPDAIIKEMTDVERSLFYALHNCKSSDPANFLEITNTNAQKIGALPGWKFSHSAVYNDISRVNHSCCPNATYRWDLATLTGEIRAVRPIAKGEQVYTTFTDALGSYAERQEFLRERYNFVCRCQACRLSGFRGKKEFSRRERSDSRRAVIALVLGAGKDYDETIREHFRSTVVPHDLVMSNMLEFVKMMEKEGVHERENEWLAILRPLVKMCCAVRDADGARKWATRAAEVTMAATGSDGGWRAVASAPDKTEFWAAGKKEGRGHWALLAVCFPGFMFVGDSDRVPIYVPTRRL